MSFHFQTFFDIVTNKPGIYYSYPRKAIIFQTYKSPQTQFWAKLFGMFHFLGDKDYIAVILGYAYCKNRKDIWDAHMVYERSEFIPSAIAGHHIYDKTLVLWQM